MKRKLLAIILSIGMLVPSLSACGSSENTVSESTVSTEEAQSSEPLTVLTRQHQAIEDYNTNRLTKIVEEKSGVKVQFETIPSE